MTEDEIQADVDALNAEMVAKQYQMPDVRLEFQSDRGPCASIRYSIEGDYQLKFFNGDSVTQAISAADAYIKSLPTGAERDRQHFVSLLSKAADFAKSKGFDEVLVNPLLEAMKKLSENALTHQPAEAETPF